MTYLQLGLYRSMSLAALVVLLPVTGFMWSMPPIASAFGVSVSLTMASLVALLVVSHFSGVSEKELSSLRNELERKSAQVLELVEAERQDDRIVESMAERLNQLKSTLILNQTRHFSGEPGTAYREASSTRVVRSNATVGGANLPEDPRTFSPQEFHLLASQFARVASRYERHFTMIRIRLNFDDRLREVGSALAEIECKAAVEMIVRTLRTSDFATLEGADSVIIGYPETSEIHVDAIMSRLRAVLKSPETRNIEIELDRRELGSKIA